MICCIGLLVGFLAGEILGIGPIFALTGFMLGLVGDVAILGVLARDKGGEVRQTMVSSVADLSHLERTNIEE